MPRPVQRADLLQYLVVDRVGGVYADIDMECLRPFDSFLDIDRLVLSIETKLTRTRQRELGYRTPWQLSNCAFAAEPGHWFLARLIGRIAGGQAPSAVNADATDSEVEDTTGPKL
jgi:inositol phosphorylceramide mannosyltransferase catalytic subunit